MSFRFSDFLKQDYGLPLVSIGNSLKYIPSYFHAIIYRYLLADEYTNNYLRKCFLNFFEMWYRSLDMDPIHRHTVTILGVQIIDTLLSIILTVEKILLSYFVDFLKVTIQAYYLYF